MATTSEAQAPVEALATVTPELAAAAPELAMPEAPLPIKQSSRKSVLAFALCALAINGSAAIYTLPSDFQVPDVSRLAELLPHLEAAPPKPDPVVAALKDIQSAQQQHTASLQENNQALQQNAALMQQDSLVLLSLRQSITDERVDVRKISSQLSTLIAKIDSLQNTMMSDLTSAIPRGNARSRLALRKRLARQPQSLGPVSVGGAPLSAPATIPAPES